MSHDFQRSLNRLQKKLDGDGPAERQILLLKLTHEFENAPDFGQSYISDASSPQQQWIARTGALLSRMGIGYASAFKAWKTTSVQFWSVSRESLRLQILEATEEIKLELQLDGHEHIGNVYGANTQYEFLGDLKDVLTGAEVEVFIVDPYFDGTAFQTFLGPLGSSCKVRVLCSKYGADVAGHMRAFKAQYGVGAELRKSRDIHDRVVIIDNQDCWVVGGSIKDAGKKPTYLAPLQPQIAPAKIAIYDGIWASASAETI